MKASLEQTRLGMLVPCTNSNPEPDFAPKFPPGQRHHHCIAICVHVKNLGVTIDNAAGVAADMTAEQTLGGFLHFTLDMSGLLADKDLRRWPTRKMTPLKGMPLF